MNQLRAVPLIAVLSVLLCAGTPGYGQEKSGALQGTVSDDTDAVLPGVTVTLTNQATNRVAVTTTGPYGNYTFRNNEPGRYSVAFELPGFTRTEFPDVDMQTAQTFRLDARLRVGPATTTVQVNDTPLVDVQNAHVAHHVPQEEFDRLPSSRTFQYLAILAPSVNTGEIEGGIQVNGASSAENVFTIDGVATQSAIDGRSRQNAAFEYLQEVRIQTGGVEAEHEGALGGVISAVTMSGGSDFHGRAWLYYGSDGLNAGPPKRLALDPADDRTVGYFQDEKNQLRALEPGFSLGGPLRRDRLYFFTSWSRRSIRQDQPYRFASGAEPGVIRRNQVFLSGFNKISFEPAERVRTHLTWLWSPGKSRGTFPAYNGSCPNCLSSTAAGNAVNTERGFFAPQSTLNGSIDFLLTPAVLLTAHASYFWDNYKDTGIPDTPSVQYQTPALGPLVPENFRGDAGVQNTPRILKHDHDRVSRASADAEIAVFGNFFGSHSLKAGAGVDKTVNDVNRYYPGGYTLVWWDRSFTGLANPQPDRGTFGYYEVNDFRTLGSAAASMKSIFVQDSWRLRDRLTVNAGVRIEHEQAPSFSRNLQPFGLDFGWDGRIAPRIGVAYDLRGDGRVKVYGSWGRYFDRTKYDLARTVFGGEIWRTYYRSLDTPDVSGLSLNNMPGRDLWNPGVTGFRNRRDAAAGLRSVDPNLQPMSQDQWSLGMDYQQSAYTVLSGRYIHQRLRRTIEDLAVLVQGNAAFIYANPGEGIAGEAPFTTGATALPLQYPKPVRTYDAVEVEIRRRFGSRWFGNVSFTWSRLYGNYSGLANSDETLTPSTGLSFPAAQQAGGVIANPARNANRGWDLDEILFDSKGNFDPQGRLATDRPFVMKWNGGYEINLGGLGKANVGALFYLGSGTPLSTLVYTRNNLPVFVNGRGDMGRTPILSYTDLQIAQTVDLGEFHRLRIELNVLNAFNKKQARHRFDSLNRGAGTPVASSAIDLSDVDLRGGYDYNARIQATPDGANAFDPRYGMEDLFSEGLSARLALKWTF